MQKKIVDLDPNAFLFSGSSVSNAETNLKKEIQALTGQLFSNLD